MAIIEVAMPGEEVTVTSIEMEPKPDTVIIGANGSEYLNHLFIYLLSSHGTNLP